MRLLRSFKLKQKSCVNVHKLFSSESLIKKYSLKGKVLVAYSGGLDSHVLLHRLANNSELSVRAIHIHHGLQAIADSWVNHCQTICKALNIPLEIVYLKPALDIPYSHHERWDGSGYPLGMRGEGIPLAARIFAVVDVYDALTNDRPYRKAWSKTKTLDYIKEQSGKQFDPQIVDCFMEIITKKDVE